MVNHPPLRRLELVIGQAPAGIARRDLHLSRRARERFHVDESLFSLVGTVIFADVAAARRLADALAAELGKLDRELADQVTPARIYALGLIHELLHRMIDRYRDEVSAAAFAAALVELEETLGRERLEQTLRVFAREFPPLPVWKGEMSLDEYLAASTAGRPHREIVLEEMLLLWLANSSPAFAPFRELFDDGPLRRETAYPELISTLEEFFADEPAYPEPEAAPEPIRPRSLIEALREPAREEPASLSGQLRVITATLPPPPPGPPAARALRAADLLREEERPVFPPGPGPVEPPSFEVAEVGPEQFTPDRDWMPHLVLIAKNALVWLWQLSQEYGKEIRRLDEIPETELARLKKRGFTGLWLIGVWQRSAASQRIKQLCGNPEAAASAYSLASYAIAEELGGEAALEVLSARAAKYGIHLGCDMVPNHFGIDSDWVLHHPERFLQLAAPPFRAYTFDGPDLSPVPEVGLFLEDHYFDRTDAAVVFKRLDRATGEAAFIYHGNDGTSTPWNDTAQLDYGKAEVRAAVLATILDVARRFPIIRFDAAMTLARRHIRRLWYPPPGTGGAIPSRAEHGLTEEEFDALMPEEFWREVVDRVAEEAPETLLLAEAFWLMESYFVRTLGMHRVYNSAFMVMLRDERNADYRTVIKNVLAFDPEILQRYVNFMSNPDERTAIDQFGSGDKAFGVTTLMATLPGLPMFGHGQLEGFRERYGMEYARSYREETPDPWITARHERQITPLLARRDLFAGSEHFVLFDFEKALGVVDEDVFAYGNRLGEERTLVVYHNRPGPTRGRIRRSVPIAVKVLGQEKPHLRWETLSHALGLEGEADAEAPAPHFLACRDAIANREHLFDPREIKGAGLALELGGYACHVFLDFQLITEDEDGRWRALAATLGGRGVPSLAEALLEPELEGVLTPFRALLEPEILRRFTALLGTRNAAEEADLLPELEVRLLTFLEALDEHLRPEDAPPRADDPDPLPSFAASVRADLATLAATAPQAPEGAATEPRAASVTFAWLLLRRLGEVTPIPDPTLPRAFLDDLLLGRQFTAALGALGLSEDEALDALLELKVLLAGLLPPLGSAAEVGGENALAHWFEEPDVKLFLRIHRFEESTYFHRESFEHLVARTVAIAELALAHEPAALAALRTQAEELAAQALAAGYRVEGMVAGERDTTRTEKGAASSGAQLGGLVSAPLPTLKVRT